VALELNKTVTIFCEIKSLESILKNSYLFQNKLIMFAFAVSSFRKRWVKQPMFDVIS
jgi:hypothetical protein